MDNDYYYNKIVVNKDIEGAMFKINISDLEFYDESENLMFPRSVGDNKIPYVKGILSDSFCNDMAKEIPFVLYGQNAERLISYKFERSGDHHLVTFISIIDGKVLPGY